MFYSVQYYTYRQGVVFKAYSKHLLLADDGHYDADDKYLDTDQFELVDADDKHYNVDDP